MKRKSPAYAAIPLLRQLAVVGPEHDITEVIFNPYKVEVVAKIRNDWDREWEARMIDRLLCMFAAVAIPAILYFTRG